jgi:hypothetical protein
MKYHQMFETGIQHASLIMSFLQLLLDAFKKQQVSQGATFFAPVYCLWKFKIEII